MSRTPELVVVGGLGNSSAAVGEAASAIANFFNAELRGAYTCHEALKNPQRVSKVVEGQILVAHSLGAVALCGAEPTEAHLFAPPLPLNRNELVRRTRLNARSIKAWEAQNAPDEGFPVLVDARELLRHAPRYILALLDGTLPRFNGLQVAAEAIVRGVKEVGVAYPSHDEYFIPTEGDVTNARNNGVLVAMGITGPHPALLLDPTSVLKEYFRLRDVA